MAVFSGQKAITIKKGGHFYRILYFPQEEPLALEALLDAAENPELNLSLSDALPFIQYLGYDVKTIIRNRAKSKAA